MPEGSQTLPKGDIDNRILGVAALFEGDFSIDWLQELVRNKMSFILKVLEKNTQLGVLEQNSIDIYRFSDPGMRERMRDFIPEDERNALLRRIAETAIRDLPEESRLAKAIADQLLHIANDLDGCQLLREAGDYFRKEGQSARAQAYYNKAIGDLGKLRSKEADIMFIESVIGYSKDHNAIGNYDKLIPYLHKALKKAEKSNDFKLLSLVLLHLASNEWIRENFEAADNFYNRARETARDLDDPDVDRSLLTGVIINHCHSGRFEEVVKGYEAHEPLFAKKYPNHRLSLIVGVLLGFSYANIGQTSQGLGIMDGVRKHALKINDYDTAHSASGDMGYILLMNNKIKESFKYLSDFAEHGAKSNNAYQICWSSYFLSYYYFKKNNPVKSVNHLKKALHISKKENYNIRWVPSLLEMCWAIKIGEFPALEYLSLENEIEKALSMDNICYKGVAYRYLGMLEKQDNKQSAEYLKQSLELLEVSGHRIELAKTNLELGRHHMALGKKSKAGDYVTEAAKTLMPIDKNLIPTELRDLIKNRRLKTDLLDEIFNFGREVVDIRDTKQVVHYIFSTINRITGAERGAIFLKNSGSNAADIELWASKGLTADEVTQPEFEHSLSLVRESVQKGKVHLQGVKGDRPRTPEQSILSLISVPMRLRGKVIGVLYHDNRLFESTFQKQDIKTLTYFASLAAIALDNARAYEEIRRLNQRLNEEKQYFEEQHLESLHFEDFIAVSQAIKRVLALVESVAKTDSTVLILGETGVGKEVVARAIHQSSHRRNKDFITAHCSALPESLVPSELFGHEKGAFTGAVKRRIGRFELADKGTLFLDEIGELPLEVQVRLLRVLQTGEFERVGGRETIRSDFRLITATNRNLEDEVAAGRFRSDLFYRLNVFPIFVPPLRERRDDIAPLACYFLKIHAEKMSKSFQGIPEGEMAKLLSYQWPGNVRELENVIERGAILSPGGHFRIPELNPGTSKAPAAGQLALGDVERQYILDTLARVKWRIYGPGGAAELLSLKPSTLYSKMKKLGIQNPGKTNKH